MLEQATTSAYPIEDAAHRARVFIQVAQAYAIIGKYDDTVSTLKQATSSAHCITHMFDHINVFISIANTYMSIRKRDHAIAILEQVASSVHSIENEQSIRQILQDMIKYFPQEHKYIIIILQHAWNMSKTHDHLWSTIGFSTPLFRAYPWLGTAILEGEEWVNGQLKRLG